MIRASIDIGSNSILLLIADVNQGKITKEIENLSEVTALGKDLDKNKSFIQASMDDSFSALKKYKEVIEAHGLSVKNTIVTATEASRVATNAKDFYKKVTEELGFQITIISANGEAHYSAKGAALDLRGNEAVIMDIGGASTELIKIKLSPFKIEKFISMPMGSVRGTDWMFHQKFDETIDQIFNSFKQDLGSFQCETLCCVAGTMTSVGNMFHGKKVFEEEVVHGTQMEPNVLHQLINSYQDLTVDQLLDKYPFLGKRAKTIIAGSKIALKVANRIGCKNLEISTYGLRYGTLIEGEIQNEFIVGKFE